MNILVTGGLGYIGSHTILELSEYSSTIHIIDNLSNSSKSTLSTLQFLLPSKKLIFHQGDIQDLSFLSKIFNSYQIDVVFHFAALKSIEQSNKFPHKYYKVNVIGTQNLIRCMKIAGVKKIIFSSSACVYKRKTEGLYSESCTLGPSSVYGYTKIWGERIVEEFCSEDNQRSAVVLRYFNPVGAHPSGFLGEDPNGEPGNLVPCIQKVACGVFRILKIFGSNYNTLDGTAIRDYVHVVDIAKGHALALNKLESGVQFYNLGTGIGTSVMEMVRAYEKVSGKFIDFEVRSQRYGDAECVVADVKKAEIHLNWKAEKTIEEMCKDSWNYVRKNLSK